MYVSETVVCCVQLDAAMQVVVASRQASERQQTHRLILCPEQQFQQFQCTMAASFAFSKTQSSFLGSSVRTQGCFVPSRVSPVAGTVVAHYGTKANPGGGKPWERTQTNQNGKPIKIKMHIKKGDIVQVSNCPCCISHASRTVHSAAAAATPIGIFC
jgi:hypothetical protein